MSPAGNTSRRVTGVGKIPLAVEILPRLTIALKVADILRSLGYPRDATPPAQVVRSTKQILTEARPWLQPRGTYALYAVTRQTAHLRRTGRQYQATSRRHNARLGQTQKLAAAQRTPSPASNAN